MKSHKVPVENGIRRRSGGLLLWCLLVLLIVVFNVRSGTARLSTDLFELLPPTELDRTTSMAADEFSRNVSNRVFLLVHSDDHEAVHKATTRLAEQLQGSGLFDQIISRIEPGWLEQIGTFYYPYRFQLLQPGDQLSTSGDLGSNLIKRSWQLLSSPSGMVSGEQLINDPLFILQRYLQALPKGANNIKPDDGYLEVCHDGHVYNLVVGLLNGSVLSLDNQQKALTSIDAAINQVTTIADQGAQSDSDVGVIRSGMIFHAGAGADNAKREVSTVGLGSVLCILLLIITVFRSATPLMLCILSISIGILAGYTLTFALSGTVHIFTLVFGASLIGVSIDYSFHYFAEWQRQQQQWSPLAGLKHIMPGITLGLITSLLGYLPMLMTPFPGLKQMAIFSTSGLFMAWLTVIAIYPRLMQSPGKNREQQNWLMGWVNGFLDVWRHRMGRMTQGYLIVVLLGCCAGAFLLTSDDDIRQLQSRSPELVTADQAVKDIVGSFTENRFFLVKGKSPEQMLQREEELVRALHQIVDKGDLKSFQAITEFLPSLKQQAINNEKLVAIYKSDLPGYMDELALTSDAVQQAQQVFRDNIEQRMTPEAWLAGPLRKTHGYLWLGSIGGEYFSAVILAGVSPEWDPVELEQVMEGVALIDKTTETSDLFGRYRVLMSWLLVAAYLLIGVVLLFRYGLAGATKVLIPPILSVLLTLSFLGLTGQAINLFHILALLMVLGIGIDYTLFFRESKGDPQYTFLAITLSAITTLLSFGLLYLSKTAAISGFGLTVLIGIGCSYLLAPFAMDEKSS